MPRSGGCEPFFRRVFVFVGEANFAGVGVDLWADEWVNKGQRVENFWPPGTIVWNGLRLGNRPIYEHLLHVYGFRDVNFKQHLKNGYNAAKKLL